MPHAAKSSAGGWNNSRICKTRDELDPATSWFVLAWDAFRAPKSSPTTKPCGSPAPSAWNSTHRSSGSLAEKKGGDMHHVGQRPARRQGRARPGRRSRGMIDALHHAAYRRAPGHWKPPANCWRRAGVDGRTRFSRGAWKPCWKCCRRRRHFPASNSTGDLRAAGSDFEALEKLRRLAFTEQVEQPSSLSCGKEEAPHEHPCGPGLEAEIHAATTAISSMLFYQFPRSNARSGMTA